MAYSIVPTVTTGDLWTAANHNTYIRDNFAAGVPDLFTTKGDIAVGTGSNVAARLGAGANTYYLVADSSQATGLKWAMNDIKDAFTTKGQIVVATAADNYTVVSVGANSAELIADSSQSAGVKWVDQISAEYCRLSSTQAITDGAYTKIQFDTVEHDPYSCLSSGRFTAPQAGYYQINASVMLCQNPNQYGMYTRCLIAIYHQGTIWGALQSIHYGTETGYPSISQNISMIKYMTASQYIDIYTRGYNGYTGWFISNNNTPKVTWLDVFLERGV